MKKRLEEKGELVFGREENIPISSDSDCLLGIEVRGGMDSITVYAKIEESLTSNMLCMIMHVLLGLYVRLTFDNQLVL